MGIIRLSNCLINIGKYSTSTNNPLLEHFVATDNGYAANFRIPAGWS